MTDTLGDLKDRIADELARSDLTSQIALAITSTISRHQRRRFYFNTKTNTFSTVGAQEYYSSSDLSDIPNILELDTATVTVDSYKRPLRIVTFEAIDDVQDGTVTGDPDFVAVYKQQLRFYPIPNAVRTVTLAYVYRLTALADNGDSNAWTTSADAEELIRHGAKASIFMNLLYDAEKAAICQAQEERALGLLLEESRRRRSAARPPRLEVAGMVDIGGGGFNISSGA